MLRCLHLSVSAACDASALNASVTCFDDVGRIVLDSTFRRRVAHDERLGKAGGTTMTHRDCCLNSGELYSSGPNVWTKTISDKFHHILQYNMDMQPWCTGLVLIRMK